MRIKSELHSPCVTRSVSPREEVTDLLSGLCSHCYRSLAECHCNEVTNQTDLSHSSPYFPLL